MRSIFSWFEIVKREEMLAKIAKLKDQDEVKEIEHEYSDSTTMDEFEELVEKVQSQLEPFSNVIAL